MQQAKGKMGAKTIKTETSGCFLKEVWGWKNMI